MGYREIGATIPRTSASDWVYQVIRKGITSGELKGGTQLKQDEISEALNVSHIPVREALRRLESEGLVTIYQNRGAQVAKLDRRAIIDMMEVRASLETMALKNSIKSFTEQDFAEMEELAAKLRTAQTTEEAEQADIAFHALLGKYSENVMATRFNGLIRDSVGRYMSKRLYTGEETRALFVAQHNALISTCRAGHTRTACELLRAHILNAIIYVPEESEL